MYRPPPQETFETVLYYLPTYLYIYLTRYLPFYLYIYLPIYISTYLPNYLPTYLSIYLFIYLHIYLPIRLSGELLVVYFFCFNGIQNGLINFNCLRNNQHNRWS